MMELIKTICCLKSENLEKFLVRFLQEKDYKNIIYKEDKYIIAEGELPVCLITHLDTVFSYVPKMDGFLFDSEKQILWFPYGSGFDDRAGVAAIITVLNKGYKPSIIFTQDEELGGVGATSIVSRFKKCPFKKCNALIELDRMGEKDCVFYNCDNRDFVKYIESFGFKEAKGTFTDISIIAPQWKIAATNLSIGYLDEHTTSERLNIDWFNKSLERVFKILDASKNMKFYKYIKKYDDFNFLFFDDNKNKNQCYFCGAPLKKHKYRKVKETSGTLKCCEDCYNDIYAPFLPFS